MTNTTGKRQSQDTRDLDRSGGKQGNQVAGSNQGANQPDKDPAQDRAVENRTVESRDQDNTRRHPNDPVRNLQTSAQQARKDGRSAQPGADADDLDSQDRIPDQRR
ncbi:MAG: hypothetical protein ACTHOH_05400 [Lysobacteraceae bacterium]